MRSFEYVRADDTAAAVALVSAEPEAEYLAGADAFAQPRGDHARDLPPESGSGPASALL